MATSNLSHAYSESDYYVAKSVTMWEIVRKPRDTTTDVPMLFSHDAMPVTTRYYKFGPCKTIWVASGRMKR